MISQASFGYGLLLEAVQERVLGTEVELHIVPNEMAFALARSGRWAQVRLGISGGLVISLHAAVQHTVSELGPADTKEAAAWAEALSRSLVSFVASGSVDPSGR